MPEYTYECEACEVYFSKVFTREEYDSKGSKVRCPECNKAKKNRMRGSERRRHSPGSCSVHPRLREPLLTCSQVRR